MKYLIITILLSTLTATIAYSQTAKTIYVSSQGNDSWNGSEVKPLRTIQKAKELVRTLSKNMQGDIQVFLRGGDYQLSQPLFFTREDGGKNGYRVIYSAYEQEKPVIHGGTAVTGWRKLADNTWVADYSGPFFRQLYVNQERRVRARHPNTDLFFNVKGFDFKHQEILVDKNIFKNVDNAHQVEMIIQMHWAESLLRIKSVEVHGPDNAKNANITIHPDDAEIFFTRPNPSHLEGQSFHLENSRAFLDQPGEWWLDRQHNKIYYKPLAGETLQNTKIFIPVIENLLIMKGESGKKVENLVFEGIRFMYANWKRPGNQPYLNIQAGFHNRTTSRNNINTVLRPESAIRLAWTEAVTFRSCEFKNLGSTALDLNFGTKNTRVVGNIFQDISGGGIMIGKFVTDSLTSINDPYNPEDKEEVSTGDEISNNYLTRVGQDYYGTCAIAAGYTDNVKIRNNYIYDVPYTGISVGYGWTKDDNAMQNNLIANNEIEKAMAFLADGGGIYTLSMQPGTKISGNYIHGLQRSPWSSPWPLAGIYLDIASGGTLENPMFVDRNVVDIDYDTGRPLNLHKNRMVLLGNNCFNYKEHEDYKEIIKNAGLEPEFRHLVKKRDE